MVNGEVNRIFYEPTLKMLIRLLLRRTLQRQQLYWAEFRTAKCPKDSFGERHLPTGRQATDDE